MARALRKSDLTFEPSFGQDGPERTFELGEYESVESHARALQLRLAQHYGTSEASADPRLDIRLRAMIIVGAASALWLAIGTAGLAAFG